jgi:hypothetical protein
MSGKMKNKLQDAGEKVADTAKTVGHKIAEGAEQAKDWVKEKTGTDKESCGEAHGTNNIREHMDVIGSCGNKLGVVDHVEGNSIKLTRNDSPDGQHHYIPMTWVARVDNHVHLSRNCGEAKREWETSTAGTGA